VCGVNRRQRPAALVGSGAAAVATRRGRDPSVTRAAGRPRACDLERAAARCAWQGRQPRVATRRWPRAVPGKARGRAVHLGGPAVVRSKVAGERIRAIGRGTSG
jgi:hypothetical protein